ncbi:hypothetical protein GH714_006143 [Hevea brasiliensis]|uniref:H(+)-exporting diphosphatase n=1 Tax=Hevea brasiliensis TaxID=3981 RepID=A0A6A6NFT8_HEVBR|nr:hypothetical protein GH714_006143 [Hevea brasiliensis]
MGVLSEGLTQVLIVVASLVGIGFALLQWFLVSKVRVSVSLGQPHSCILSTGISVSSWVFLVPSSFSFLVHSGLRTKSEPCTYSKGNLCKPALANAIFSTIAFLLGALTSVLSGFLGMKIATYANARTTLQARKGVGKAFITAFRSGR